MIHPPLIINGVDFNQILDREKANLHFRIDALRISEYFANTPIMLERNSSMIKWFQEKSDQIFGLPSMDNYIRRKGMQIRQDNKFILHDPFA